MPIKVAGITPMRLISLLLAITIRFNYGPWMCICTILER